MAEGDAEPAPTPRLQRAMFQALLRELAPRALVTPILVGLNVTVFVLMTVRGVSVFVPTPDDLLAYGANFGPLTTNGGWWRLLSSMFIHIGIAHLLMNMWVLWVTGPTVERMFGSVSFAIAYLVAGLAGSLASVAWHPDIASAGASGAIFGIYGMLGAFLLRQRGTLPPAVLSGLKASALGFVAYNVLYGATQSGIDMAAHVGGLAGGFLIGLPLVRELTPGARAGQTRRAATTGAVAAVLLAGICALVPRTFSLGDEMARVGGAQRHLGARITELAAKGASPEQLASLVDTELFPTLESADQRIRDHRNTLVPAGQKQADISLQALEKHRQAARKLAAGLRSNDLSIVEEAGRVFEEANSLFSAAMKDPP